MAQIVERDRRLNPRLFLDRLEEPLDVVVVVELKK